MCRLVCGLCPEGGQGRALVGPDFHRALGAGVVGLLLGALCVGMSLHGLYLVWAGRERERETWSLFLFSQGHSSQPSGPVFTVPSRSRCPSKAPPPSAVTLGTGLQHRKPGAALGLQQRISATGRVRSTF